LYVRTEPKSTRDCAMMKPSSGGRPTSTARVNDSFTATVHTFSTQTPVGSITESVMHAREAPSQTFRGGVFVGGVPCSLPTSRLRRRSRRLTHSCAQHHDRAECYEQGDQDATRKQAHSTTSGPDIMFTISNVRQQTLLTRPTAAARERPSPTPTVSQTFFPSHATAPAISAASSRSLPIERSKSASSPA